MDFNQVNELFDSHVPEFDFQLLPDQTHHSIIIPDLPVMVAWLIALSFITFFCKFRHCWLVNAKCALYINIAKVWKGKLYRLFSNYFERKANDLSKKLPSEIVLNPCSRKDKEVNNLNRKISNEHQIIRYNKDLPIKTYEEENNIHCLKNNFGTSPAKVTTLTMMMNKKLREDVNLRLELLSYETKLCLKTKQMKELEKSLREVRKDAALNCRRFQNEILNKYSLGPRRRVSFFRKTSDPATVTLLQNEISSKNEKINSLKELNKKIYNLYEQVQKQDIRLQGEKIDKIIKLQEQLNLIKEKQEQIFSGINGLGSDLSLEGQGLA